MNVFGFVILKEVRLGLSALRNLVQRGQDVVPFLGGEHTGGAERLCMGAARRQVIEQQRLVEWKRPLPLLELWIKRPPKPAGPHLHFVTSWRMRARVRAGRPR